ncbi:MAG: hypothetical protein LQ341_000904 [Variospora aurantia]|nr:MAG: hypothetical protein LQ341_000904 [Variospora aurantia]
MIFSFLTKQSLKDVRRTSKVFSALATRHLFNKVYVGPSSLTLGIFQNIVNHTVMSACIKTLVYDATSFHHINNFEEYCQLFKSWCSYARRRDGSIEKKESLSVRETERCLVLVYGDLTQPDPHAKTAEAINDNEATLAAQAMATGFDRWNEQRTQQRHYAATNEMRTWLTLAMCRLPNLTSISLQTSWSIGYFRWIQGEKHLSLLPNFNASGPLARSWSSWHVPPGSFEDKPDHGSKMEDIVLTMALSGKCAPTRPVGNLVGLDLDVHISTFKHQANWANLMSERFEDVLASIKYLRIRLHSNDSWASTIIEPINLLTSSLTKGRNLQNLDLSIDPAPAKHHRRTRNYCPIHLRAPHDGFPGLECLRLSGMRVNLQQIIGLLTAQPALVSLELDTLCLMTEIDHSISNCPRSVDTLWTLVEGIIRLQPLKFLKLQPPLLDGVTQQLISTKTWKAAGYDDQIKGFAEGRGLNQVHGGYLYMHGQKVRKIQ